MSQKPELCVICQQRPAAGYLGEYPLCEPCYNAVTAPDPICFECGAPLSEVETETQEALCQECREEKGEALSQGAKGDIRPGSAIDSVAGEAKSGQPGSSAEGQGHEECGQELNHRHYLPNLWFAGPSRGEK